MFLLRVICTMVAILIIAWLFPSIMRVDGAIAALVAAFILGIVNGVLRPVLIILTLPITLMSFGFFLLIINGLMLGLVSFIVPGLYVNVELWDSSGSGGAKVSDIVTGLSNKMYYDWDTTGLAAADRTVKVVDVDGNISDWSDVFTLA